MMPTLVNMKTLVGKDETDKVETNDGEDSSTSSMNSDEILDIVVGIPYGRKPQKTFQFQLEETVWAAKQAVLLEFSQMHLSDPLNFGFYLPPHNGRAGKFLDEERPLKDYPMTKEQPFLEFRYKRKIFRGVNMEEKKLLKQNSKIQQKKFLEAISTQGPEKVAVLLEKGIDPNFQDEKTGETPLSTAVASPQPQEMIKLLIGNGMHLDYRTSEGLTALHKAAIIGKSEALKTLLDLGASPNCKDAKGLTPLYHTVLEGSDSYCCELLLADYAQTGIVDHQGIQEIHQACRKGRIHHLEFLLYYGVDVNARTASGNTPLHICAISNHADCVQLLLCRGADKDAVNYSNQSAYEVAILAGNHELSEVIKNFKESEIQPFSTSPHYTDRGKGGRVLAKVRSFENLLAEPSPFLKRAISDSTMASNRMRSTSDSGFCFPENRFSANIDKFHDADSGESDSEESDSDDGMSTVRRRTFSNAGVGTQRAPAPVKSTAGGAAQLKNRLYASVPGRSFVAVIDYKPNAPGELALEKGEQVEVLYVGEQGFWEGRVGGRAGWFPSCCVQEVKKSKKSRPKTWFGTKKSSSLELIEKITKFDKPVPRKVTLKRNDKGFGFQLRGANSHTSRIDFTPTAQFPALQYIGEVDKGGVADKAGLKPGDFVLEVNGEDVTNSSHGRAVNVINKGGKTLTMKVVTVTPECMSPDLTIEDGAARGTLKKERSNSMEKKPPPPKPPVRSPYTCLTMGRVAGAQIQMAQEDFASVSHEDTVMTLEKKEVKRQSSMKSIWSESAWKLRSNDQLSHQNGVVNRGSDVTKGTSRSDRVKSLDVDRHYPNHMDLAVSGTVKRDRSNSQGLRQSDVASDIRPIGANYPGYLTLPRKSSRKVSESSDDDPSKSGRKRYSSTSSQENEPGNEYRNTPPPDYEHTMENLRKMGRKSSYVFEQSGLAGPDSNVRTLPRCQTVPSNMSEHDALRVAQEERHRHHSVIAPPPSHPAPSPPNNQTRMPEFKSSLVEGASYRTLPRSVSVPAHPPQQPMVVQHRPASFSDLSSKSPVPEPEPAEKLSPFAQSLANAVKRRESRVEQSGKDCETLVTERRKSVVGAGFTGARKTAEENPAGHGAEVKVTLNGDESPKGSARLGGAEQLLQRRDSKGSEYFSLYTSSSTASLDSQCSKDSGIDTSSLGSNSDLPPDHASALAHAVAARAARLASKDARDANDPKRNCAMAETTAEVNRLTVEEVSLVRPSSILQSRKTPQESSPKKSSFSNPPTKGKESITAQSVSRDHNDNEMKSWSLTASGIGNKVPPPTKPKPSHEKRGNAHREPRLEAVPEDTRISVALDGMAPSNGENNTNNIHGLFSPPTHYPDRQLTSIPPISNSSVPNNKFSVGGPSLSDEDLATMYLDEVISEAQATIDSDVISVQSLRMDSPHQELMNGAGILNNGSSPAFLASSLELDADVVIPPPPPPDTFGDLQFPSEDLPPPVMFSESADFQNSIDDSETSPLPPPPDDFLDEGFEEQSKKSSPSINGSTCQEPPPPYSPPKSGAVNVPNTLANKSYIDWNVHDVLSWLEFINMAQYKSTFLDNDIRGVHLPELSKEDLAELGIKKLGHRMTIDDAIGKLCRAFTEA